MHNLNCVVFLQQNGLLHIPTEDIDKKLRINALKMINKLKNALFLILRNFIVNYNC